LKESIGCITISVVVLKKCWNVLRDFSILGKGLDYASKLYTI